MNSTLFFVIFVSAIFFLSLDSTIGYVSDFLVEQNTSAFGTALFVGISTVFIISSFAVIRFIAGTSSEVQSSSLRFRILHKTTLGTQVALVTILVILLVQIFLFSEYSKYLLVATAAISPTIAAVVMIVSFLILVSWFRFNKGSYVAIIFALAFLISAYVFVYSAVSTIDNLTEKADVITPQSEVIYSSDTFEPGSFRDILLDIYRFAAVSYFVLFIAGSAIMLRHYSSKVGHAKFWIFVLLPSIYYVTVLLDSLGIYAPESETDLFNYYVYASLNGIIGGLLLGFLFWSISRTMRPSKSVSGYLRLCAYGFILLSVATVGQVSVAAYPPYGYASFSMLPLSSYMIILGLYSAATSISQDVRLRQYIKELTKEDSGFLSTIGEAQLEKKLQAKAMDLENVVKEQREELEKKSGVESSVQQQDIKQYLLEVLQEVDRHKAPK